MQTILNSGTVRQLTGLAVQMLILILLSPLLGGIINKVKALTQKRKGAPVLQMYRDLAKLFHKECVVSDQASWIFRTAPYIVFASAICAAAFVPVSPALPLPLFAGDAFLVISCLALGRFFLALAGLDAGSTFGGMGSSREMTLASFVEPGLVVSLLTLGLVAGTSSVGGMMAHMQNLGWAAIQPLLILIFISLFISLIAETARIPVDDPATHLELTMIHEAMILEHSGRQLAFLEWGNAVKQLLFITLIAGLLPSGGLAELAGLTGAAALVISLVVYLLKVLIVTVLLAVVECVTVKLKFFSVPNLAVLSLILSLLGFLQYFVLGGTR